MNEVYSGVKFTPVYRKQIAPRHPKLPILKQWCALFDELQLAPPYPGGSYGNLSFRTERDSFIITGTSIGLKNNLDDSCFVEIHNADIEQGEIEITGVRPPSSETFMHALLYGLRPEIMAVFHGHNAIITEHAKGLGIAETASSYAYGTAELAQGVAEVARHATFLVIKEHGFVALGASMQEAGELSLHWLEQSRRMAL